MKHSTERMRALIRALLLAAAGTLAACGAFQEKPDRPERPDAPPATPAPTPDKGDPQGRFDAAMALWQQNQIAEAEEAFVSLVQDFPQHSGPWTNLGILYAKSNRRPQAIGALTKAVSLNPQNKVAFNWLGILHREAGDLNRARLSYEKALQLDPDYALAHYNLAILLDAHLKQPAEALPHYRAYRSAGSTRRSSSWPALW